MNRKKILFIFSLVLLTLFILNLFVGSQYISPAKIFSLSETEKVIIFDLRLKESITAILVGIGLGFCGSLMQTILNNPLADPFTLGISASAGFGASLLIILGASFTYISLGAIAFAFVAMGFVYLLSKKKSMTSFSMVLSGIAVKFFFDSLLSLLQYRSDEQTLTTITFWLFGSLARTEKIHLLVLTVLIFFGHLLVFSDIWELTAIRFGEKRARAMGVDIKKLKIKSYLIISIIGAFLVSFTGTIGFIGLASPHISRKLLGDDQRFYILGSSLVGANLLIFSSIISKIIRPGVIIPIGIITAIIGLPILFMIIVGDRND